MRTLALGDSHACAIVAKGAVKCWGDNSSGQLGYGDVVDRGKAPGEIEALPVVDLGSGRSAKSIFAGRNGTCAILDNDRLKCWGEALSYEDERLRGFLPNQMGDNLPYVDLGTGRTVKALSIGSSAPHKCAILDNDKVKCWLGGSGGQTGNGDAITRGDKPGTMGDNLPYVDLGTGRVARTIVAGFTSTCALLDNETVKCWGASNYGSTGYGSTDSRGAAPNQMGDQLPAVDLGAGRSAKAIFAGSFHYCAILDNAQVKCWGNNAVGQLGYGDTNARGDAPGEMGDALLPLNLGTNRTAVSLALGTGSTCAALDDGSVKCWGASNFGGLGYGDKGRRGDGAGEMGDALPALNLGTGRTVKELIAGGSHQCARLDNAQLKCWGANYSGELGLGDKENRGDDPGEMGDALLAVPLGP